MEALLSLMRDLEAFSPPGDRLSRMLAEADAQCGELKEEELEWIAAARKDPVPPKEKNPLF